MSVTSLFDASELTAFADKLLSKGVARRAAITMVVKKGAQNVKNDIREDLSGSGNKAFRRIPITYEVKERRDASQPRSARRRAAPAASPTSRSSEPLKVVERTGSTSMARKSFRSSRNMWLVPQWRDSSAVDNDLVEHDSRPCAETG